MTRSLFEKEVMSGQLMCGLDVNYCRAERWNNTTNSPLISRRRQYLDIFKSIDRRMKIFKSGSREKFNDEKNWEFLIEPIISFLLHQLIEESLVPRFRNAIKNLKSEDNNQRQKAKYLALKCVKEKIFVQIFYKIMSIIEGTFIYSYRINIFISIVHAYRRGGLNEIRILSDKLEEFLKNSTTRYKTRMTSYKERSVLHFLKRWYPKAFIKYNETRISTRNTSKIIYRQEMMATYFQGTYFSEELEDNENENYTASLVMRFDIESQCGKKLKHRNKILTLQFP